MEEPLYKPREVEIGVTPPKGQVLRETDSRILIDRKLREAFWNIEDKNQVSTEAEAAKGRADYILRDSRGRSIAIIEAKRFSVDPVAAKQQALEYAEATNTDFIFLSNGEDIYFWDYKYRPEQKVATFFSQRDLEKLQTQRLEQKPVSAIPIPEKYFKGGEWREPRQYQKEAMIVMDKSLENGKRKMLLLMATGTGKTDTVALYLKRLFEAGVARRVLFLVDRIDLGQQAQDAFGDILADYPSKLLYGGRESDESSIIISTLPTIYSQLSNFTSGYFDVVVSDEAHRGIYGIYNAVLSHFDAIRIGLTATPSILINHNTYKLFDCWDERKERGEPTFTYGIRRGIKEGYLAGYDIVRIETKLSLEGVEYENEDYNPEDLERRINIPARNEQIAKAYRQEEESRGDGKLRKAIVFAVTKRHAAQLAYYLNQAFPEHNGRFAEVITSDTQDPRAAIRKFKLEGFPKVAVSVGMLDTGIDAPMVENLVMVRPTRSAILYQQMRGRGSRLDRSISKTSFRIYDFAGVTAYFNDESYNPYSNILKARTGIPWGTEETDDLEDLTDEQKEAVQKLQFVQVPESAPENVDSVVQRTYVEVGPEGESIDADEYQTAWEKEVQELAQTEPLISKVKEGQELTSDETAYLGEKLNSPKFYFNEANLREAYGYPPGTLNQFIRTALDIEELPTEEQLLENRVNDLFESWLLEKNLSAEQTKLLRLVKEQYIANKERVDVSIFTEPVFQYFGGLNHVLTLFDADELKKMLQELNQRIFVQR
ncbi:MAG: DEAD/DEAH box helicase family protein [Candidatus Wildermuthbacteria bacterium]|nr:DEAD/DEAH box helicase family protein [Candidatus Wildermuthbacteria bacterium]